ncbi:MAG: PAS domain S-box protein [bacterium]|nr:PAS domain S-box protein [bacterium]
MEVEKSLEKRIVFERMLAEISAEAISIKDISAFINKSINRIGNTLDVSRINIYDYEADLEIFFLAYEWVQEGVSLSEDSGTAEISMSAAFMELKKGKIFNFPNTQLLPKGNHKEICEVEETKSTLIVPLFTLNQLSGFICFDECRSNRTWQSEDIYILTTAGQIITRAMESKHTEEDLLKHRRCLEAIFRSVQDGIITVDRELTIINANDAISEICGITPVEIIGKPFAESMKHCKKACFHTLSETAGKKTIAKEYRIKCMRAGSDEQIVIITSSPLVDINGAFMGAVLGIRDITKLNKLEQELKEKNQYQGIIGKSKKMQDVFSLVKKLANIETTVLITGESGTGKELIARALHQSGQRASKPFIAVNCSALPENLLESELFGHVKGSFTGAISNNTGRFLAADGGTIMLDEIADSSPNIQLKLLRVLQEKVFEVVGETASRKVDIRVIATTNCDLKEKIKKGGFREDFYYRLKVIEIPLPPLRERLEDIPLLIQHFCRHFSDRFKKNIESVSDEVLRLFMSYSWPGNVRELEHTIEHACILCGGKIITIKDIPSEIGKSNKDGVPKTHDPGTDEAQNIQQILEKNDWNKSKSARLLGISRQALYNKIYKYKLKPGTPDP